MLDSAQKAVQCSGSTRVEPSTICTQERRIVQEFQLSYAAILRSVRDKFRVNAALLEAIVFLPAA